MQVILQADVKGSGKAGQLINVSDGYARNFLLPKGLAVAATKQNLNVMTSKKAAIDHKLAEQKKAAEELCAKLADKTIKIIAKSGEGGRLFGSVTSKEIAEEIEKQLGLVVDKKKLDSDDIKSLGSHQIEAKVFTDISATFYVVVSAE